MNKNLYERRLAVLKFMIEGAEWDVEECVETYGKHDPLANVAEGRLHGLKEALKVMTGEWDRYLDI